MGWGTFLIAYVTLAATLFCPGYLALRSLRLGRQNALCLAPAVTLVLVVILGLVYARLGIRGGYLSIVVAPACVLVIVFLLSRPWRDGGTGDPRADWRPLLLFLVVGVVMTFMFFCGNLEGVLGSYQPDNDNAYHLSLIKSIADSGNYSILNSSVYAASPVAPFSTAGAFYPAAFHCLAAVAVDLFNLGIPMAENALAAVIISLVWPLSVYWALVHVFPHDKVALYSGAVVCMNIIAFPWRFFAWGPLFPNMLSLALVPGAVGTFMDLASRLPHTKGIRTQLLVFLVSAFAIAVAHPNGIFTLGILLVPYTAALIYRGPEQQGGHASARKSRHIVPMLLFLALVAVIWIVAYRLPALRSVVGFAWEPYEDFGLGLLGAFTLKMAGNRSQSLMGILLVIGLVQSLRDRRNHTWLFALFVFVALQFAVSASLRGPVRQLLCGFWYTDPNRIAANVAIAAVPVVSLGVSETLALLRRLLKAEGPLPESAALGLTLSVLAVLVGTSVLGHISEEEPGFQLSTTASYDFNNMLEFKYSTKTAKAYDATEQAFVDKVLKTVPKGTLLLNLPNDGSCFAYALQDANVLYKDVTSPDIYAPGQTEAARILRRNLDHISTMPTVQAAARSLDAHYLLLLDKGVGIQKDNQTLPEYHSSDWRGVISIGDDTPGFEIVLAEGDMRLYRIEY